MKTTLQMFFARHRLDETERTFFNTLCAIFRDRELAAQRKRLRAGEITLTIEGDEVVWVDADQVGAELQQRLLAQAPTNGGRQ